MGVRAQSGLQEKYECEGEFSKLSGEQDRSFILDFEADNAVFFNECKYKLRFERNLKVRAVWKRARGPWLFLRKEGAMRCLRKGGATRCLRNEGAMRGHGG